MDRRIEVGEGLVGRCYIEAEPIYLLEIPDNYITITSGLGDTPPRCLLLVPLKVDKEVNGVIELASLQPIAQYKIDFVQKVAESIASTLKAARVNERTAKLLGQTKLQAEEMAAAEEEMRQNLEELQSTQEEMARVQEEQKRAMDKVTTDNQMFEALLQSTSEYVYFKDSTGHYVKASDSARVLLNVNQIEDAIGKTAFELFPTDVAQEIEKEDQAVMKSQTPLLKQQGKLTYKDGTTKTVEKNKYPVKNTGQEVVGLISIYKEV
jgi:PAS domain-containing protein